MIVVRLICINTIMLDEAGQSPRQRHILRRTRDERACGHRPHQIGGQLFRATAPDAHLRQGRGTASDETKERVQ